MLSKIYTVFDSKAQAYLQPFYSPNDAVALRNFQTAATDENHHFNKHAADYTLFLIGEYDDTSASITMLPSAKNLGCALTFKASTRVTQISPAVEK